MRQIFIVCVLAFALASPAFAVPGKNRGAAKTSTVTGSFVGFQENKNHKKIVITVTSADGKTQEQSVRIDDSTKITLDGNPATSTSLKPGETLTISLTKKLATEIDAVSK